MQYIIGCSSTCTQERLKNGSSCTGTDGCCQAALPKGVRKYDSYFNEQYNTSQICRRTPCNYIAVMETAAFNFSTTYLTSTVFYDMDSSLIPTVLEWGVAQKTCEEARTNKTAYACVSNNSDCIDNNYVGYHCKCSPGYKGNPYVPDGCTGSSLHMPLVSSSLLPLCISCSLKRNRTILTKISAAPFFRYQ